ncbi:RraA family protein [Streptomyces werraensis]|uniref:Putative 4-hydroxy-4-methyl-2-oxoglutarate aldolase n=1 Tax=Streptomyces werraensis TaxID=68284 RepID=A0ABV3JP06_9ACTN
MTAALRTKHTSATLLEAAKSDIALDPALRPLWPDARLAGPAYTVQGVPGDNLALHNAVAAAPPGHVLVADCGGGSFGHWGEVLAVAAKERGLLGLVIDGAVRDSAEQAELGFPVFSRGIAIHGTAKRYPGILGRSVLVGGVVVRTGDLVVGDADGLVAIPSAHEAAVLAAADGRVEQETFIMSELSKGRTTVELLRLNPLGD